MKRTARTAALAPVSALLSAVALAGCVGDPPAPEPTSAPVAYAGAWLPEGFPVDDVPLVSDDVRYGIVFGAPEGRPVYTVAVAVDGNPSAAIDAQLLGAGFERRDEQGWGRSGSGGWATFVADKWWITASVIRVDGTWYAKYAVAGRS